MLIASFFVAACLGPVILNLTDIWSIEDEKALNLAKNNCTIYYDDSPCLELFVKEKERTYKAVCSKPSL